MLSIVLTTQCAKKITQRTKIAPLGGFLFPLFIAKLAMVTTAKRKFQRTDVAMPPWAHKKGGTRADQIQNDIDKNGFLNAA